MTLIFRITCAYTPFIQVLHRIIPHMNRFCIERQFLERFEPIQEGFLHIVANSDVYTTFLQFFANFFDQPAPQIPDHNIPFARMFEPFQFPDEGMKIIFESGNDDTDPRDWFGKMEKIFQKVPKVQITIRHGPSQMQIHFPMMDSFQLWAFLMNRRYL